MEHLIETFGYWAILIGTFFEGETVLVLAGFAAHRGWLDLPWVMVAAFCGSVAGDQLWYYIGRRHGTPLLMKRPTWRERMDKVSARIRRHGDLLVLTSRFLYGLRTVIPFAVGAARVPPLRYAVLNIAGAAVWSVAFAFLGYYLGEALSRLLPRFHHYEHEALIALAALGLAFWIIRTVRRARRAKRLTEATPSIEQET